MLPLNEKLTLEIFKKKDIFSMPMHFPIQVILFPGHKDSSKPVPKEQ
jgi:hypothetical protein